jgi:hypothetical protein
MELISLQSYAFADKQRMRNGWAKNKLFVQYFQFFAIAGNNTNDRFMYRKLQLIKVGNKNKRKARIFTM